jgi:hypothetical protein
VRKACSLRHLPVARRRSGNVYHDECRIQTQRDTDQVSLSLSRCHTLALLPSPVSLYPVSFPPFSPPLSRFSTDDVGRSGKLRSDNSHRKAVTEELSKYKRIGVDEDVAYIKSGIPVPVNELREQLHRFMKAKNPNLQPFDTQ